MKQILLILLLALIFSGVLFINTNSTFVGDGGDNFEFLGFMYITKSNLAALKHPFADTDILRYPSGFDYSFGFDGVFAILTGSFLSFIAHPVLAYNLTLIIIFFINILVSYYSFIKLAGLYKIEENLKLKSLISALIFGSSPFVFARINSHLNLAFIAGFPLLITQLLILNKKITQNILEIKKQDLNLISLSLLLIAFGSLQYIILLAYVLPIFLLYFLVTNSFKEYLKFLKLHLRKVILSATYFLIIFLSIYWGYFRAIFTGSIIYAESIHKFFRPGILDLIMPNQYLGELWAIFNHSEMSIERVITVGTLELALFVYLMIKTKRRKLRLWGLILFVFYLVLSFGWLKLPFYPEGGRVTILLSLFIAILFLLEANVFKNPVVLSLFFALVIIERLFFNLHVIYPLESGVLKSKVAPAPGEAVLNVPLSKYETYRSALPFFYQKKVLDGYFHYTAANARSERLLDDDLFSRFICQQERADKPVYDYQQDDRQRLFDALRRMDIRTVVLFKDDNVGQFFWTGCENVKDWWYWLNPATLAMSSDTHYVVKYNFEIAKVNPRTIAEIYFERDGRFVLSGLYATPRGLDDWLIILPDGKKIYPQWQESAYGYEVSFDPAIEINAKAGDSLYITSGNKVDFNRYINVFYLFEENKTSLARKRVPLENIYSDKNVEIYQLNQ